MGVILHKLSNIETKRRWFIITSDRYSRATSHAKTSNRKCVHGTTPRTEPRALFTFHHRSSPHSSLLQTRKPLSVWSSSVLHATSRAFFCIPPSLTSALFPACFKFSNSKAPFCSILICSAHCISWFFASYYHSSCPVFCTFTIFGHNSPMLFDPPLFCALHPVRLYILWFPVFALFPVHLPFSNATVPLPFQCTINACFKSCVSLGFDYFSILSSTPHLFHANHHLSLLPYNLTHFLLVTWSSHNWSSSQGRKLHQRWNRGSVVLILHNILSTRESIVTYWIVCTHQLPHTMTDTQKFLVWQINNFR